MSPNHLYAVSVAPNLLQHNVYDSEALAASHVHIRIMLNKVSVPPGSLHMKVVSSAADLRYFTVKTKVIVGEDVIDFWGVPLEYCKAPPF